MNESVSDGGVCRTAPATPGLFNISGNWVQLFVKHFSDKTLKIL